MELAYRYLSPILSPLATLGIVFVVAVFALLQREDLRDRLIRLVGSDDLHRTTLAIDDGGRRLSKYFITQLSINTAFGVVVGIGLFFIGVPNPVLWGILSALLRFVPYVGSFIAAVLPLGLAAAVEPGWSMVLWTAALYVVVEGVTGQVIEPMVYGHSTGLSPFSVVAAIFWSWLWGPVGLILSTPLTLCLVVMGRHVKRLEFLDVLLGDQPALTPVESFYQRILAGDADETEDHAELLLKECSLSTYYDEVAVKGLQMAAEDARRGTLDEEKLEKVKSTVNALVQSLAGHDDAQPPAPKAKDERRGRASRGGEGPHHNPDPSQRPGRQLPASWRGSKQGPVHCRPGSAGRGGRGDAVAAHRQAWHGRPCGRLRRGVARRDRRLRRDRRGDGVHLLPRPLGRARRTCAISCNASGGACRRARRCLWASGLTGDTALSDSAGSALDRGRLLRRLPRPVGHPLRRRGTQGGRARDHAIGGLTDDRRHHRRSD